MLEVDVMPCFVPEPFRRFKEHLLLPDYGMWPEVAEWVPVLSDGEDRYPCWKRWGQTYDYALLCAATYIRPLPAEGE
jgi:hypothetical protein